MGAGNDVFGEACMDVSGMDTDQGLKQTLKVCMGGALCLEVRLDMTQMHAR